MISTELARALHDSGLAWHPASGDAFRIDRPEVDADVFTVSEMTVEAYEHPTGTILGFNGTTEWALDSVDLEDALWLPREDQLRELLRATFRSLQRDTGTWDGESVYRVEAVIAGRTVSFTGSDAADAYGRALLALIDLSSASPIDDQAADVPWIS
ncbi:pilus assembly protein CpaE [Marisediminicola antarctica]|uniref:Pilus assembly protein CpaE n=1 Tax=Marisediminicola antarctica TaxID=674079 RepID=A0A7L5AGM8_9MICO|nr:pilus assembly protein CpaE [Marisediminicola antarctica]QHO69142.1 pilus assembly protein CpaE [Marisediminicola antarctica]